MYPHGDGLDNTSGSPHCLPNQRTLLCRLWTTLMQAGELLHLADNFEDEDATRVFVCHQSPVDEGYMSQLASRLKVRTANSVVS